MTKKILLFALFALILCSVVCAESSDLRNKKILFRKSFSSSEVSSLKVELSSENVIIEVWNKESIQVVVYGKKDYPIINVQNRILSITKPYGIYRPEECYVQVILPEDFFANDIYGSTGFSTNSGKSLSVNMAQPFGGIEVSTTSGYVDATLLWGENISVSTSSGSVELSKCQSENVTIVTKSGNINVNDCSFIKDARITSNSGSINFFAKTPAINAMTDSGSINAKLKNILTETSMFITNTGTITISLPRNSEFKLNFGSNTGKIYNEFTGYKGSGLVGNDIVGSGIPLIQAQTAFGNIQVLAY